MLESASAVEIVYKLFSVISCHGVNKFTPGLNLNLDKSQCTGAIDSANIAVLSADFKNVIFKMIQWA